MCTHTEKRKLYILYLLEHADQNLCKEAAKHAGISGIKAVKQRVIDQFRAHGTCPDGSRETLPHLSFRVHFACLRWTTPKGVCPSNIAYAVCKVCVCDKWSKWCAPPPTHMSTCHSCYMQRQAQEPHLGTSMCQV